ncbi:MAG TPA: helix-turn-helix transcriptional regulator [Actinomycetota bacterium]|nr:helix-turn-helix transcriptional regulator [Actinomycetota bacterium]
MPLAKAEELGNFIRDQRQKGRVSLRKLSHLAGISNPYLSQIERGLRRPSAEILQAIAKALRISSESLYVKAGILEERDETMDVATAIVRDHTLNEKQKQLLIDVYQSFRHENELEGNPPAAVTAERGPAKKSAPKSTPKTARNAAKPKKSTTSTKSTAKKKAAPRRSSEKPAARAQGTA